MQQQEEKIKKALIEFANILDKLEFDINDIICLNGHLQAFFIKTIMDEFKE